MDKKTLSTRAIEARRAYKREHYAKNRDKYREYRQNHWERKALAEMETAQNSENGHAMSAT